MAEEIKETIKYELGLTVSIGVSFNKIFAKLGSDMKKPDAITVINKETFREQIWNLPASEMLGVGRATEKKLSSVGIRTIGQIAQYPCDYFQRKMIKKCRQKKIDLILVKSISRFSRNTVDCLEYIRELKALGIGVIFEKENINTLTETSEAMITIMGYFAQAESESISKNVTWGVRHAFSEGKVTFTCDIYGYERVYNPETKNGVPIALWLPVTSAHTSSIPKGSIRSVYLPYISRASLENFIY